MPQYTATVEAQYADELREKRDRTDEQIAREFFFLTDAQERREAVKDTRKKDAYTRRNWNREAAERAFSEVCMDAYDDGFETLDEAEVTLTIRDLTATAVLTLPEKD